MRIHTKLHESDFDAAAEVAKVDLVGIVRHGSRSHDHAFDVHLEGAGTRRPNGGSSGAGSGYAATWDQWGIFLAALYDQDPDMLCGSKSYATYENRKDFHYQTARRFDRGWPADYHTNHTWDYDRDAEERRCRRCKAIRRWR